MSSRQIVQDITGKMVQSYRSIYGDSIVNIFLYGSYARGDYRGDSDIDIVAIVQGERLSLQEKLKRVWDEAAEVGLEYDVIVSPTVIPYDEYKKYQTVLPYYRNIDKEGIRIG